MDWIARSVVDLHRRLLGKVEPCSEVAEDQCAAVGAASFTRTQIRKLFRIKIRKLVVPVLQRIELSVFGCKRRSQPLATARRTSTRREKGREELIPPATYSGVITACA